MESGVPTRTDALIVIPCLNEQSYIERAIRSILCDPLAKTLRIVVADGGSTDGTLELLAKLAKAIPNLRVIANPRRIQSAGVNLAARTFGQGCQWLIRIDAHAEYPAGFVSQLIAEATRTGATSVVVAMRARGTTCFQKATAVAQNSALGAGGSPHRRNGADGFVDHGHHALFDLQSFLALNGYNEAQSHNEDAEFDVRLARSGGRIFLTRATAVTYYPRTTALEVYRQYRNFGRGRATTILRHRVRPKLRQMLPAGVAPAIGCATLTHWFAIAALPAAVWLTLSLVFGIVLGCTQRSRCAFASGLAAAIMHTGWSVGFWSGVFGYVRGGCRLPDPALEPVSS